MATRSAASERQFSTPATVQVRPAELLTPAARSVHSEWMSSRQEILTLVSADGRVLCERVEVAETILSPARGLLGRSHLARGTGMNFRPG